MSKVGGRRKKVRQKSGWMSRLNPSLKANITVRKPTQPTFPVRLFLHFFGEKYSSKFRTPSALGEREREKPLKTREIGLVSTKSCGRWMDE